MAFQYRHGIVNLEVQIKVLYFVILLLLVTQSFLMVMCYQLKQEQVIRLPADLRYSSRQKISEVPPSFVYSYAYYILQQLYTWRSNGEKDFGENIYFLQAYLTPNMHQILKQELKQKAQQGELKKRVRFVQELPGEVYQPEKVTKVGSDRWIVLLDLEIQEYVHSKLIKQLKVRYPIEVVRFDVDPEKNEYGLALAGFAKPGPQRLSEEGGSDE